MACNLRPRDENKLTNEIKSDIRDFDQESWRGWLTGLIQEDNLIYEANRKISKKHIQIPLILDTDGVKYTPHGKANAFKYSLGNSFQINPEPYDNRQMAIVHKAVCHHIKNAREYFDVQLTSPRKSPLISRKLIQRKPQVPMVFPTKFSN
ncbi:hypothetical protein AVEN_190798-1 [Araneus ventricosus]|uniref:Uncharacterized protein n=1 Tax=Araneus ventricosus TaxID=182803 RepID=A0A4Y2L8K7_ARAVE|nr:hypothetical protein AVEN_190798-1 [Araneus ventricosus]